MRYCLLFVCLAFPLRAAHAEETLEQRAIRELGNKPREQFLTITEENDLFGAGTDRNYTNGIRIGWLDTSATPPKATHFVENYLPFFSINQTTSVYYSVGQNLYLAFSSSSLSYAYKFAANTALQFFAIA